MSGSVDRGLGKIASGTIFILIGIFVGYLLSFVARILIVRHLSSGDFGIYSLCFTVTSVCLSLALLGLEIGTARQIAFYRGSGDYGRVRGVISSSIKITLVSSLILLCLLFLLADIVANVIYDVPEMTIPLRIFSVGIPFIVLMRIILQVYRGFNIVKPYILFEDVIRNIVFILCIGIVLLLNLQLTGVIGAFILSAIITFIIVIIYFKKKPPLEYKTNSGSPEHSVLKELLVFSMPLFLVVILRHVTTWTDTLMLGYFVEVEEVGLYNGALPLAHLLPTFLGAVLFLYVPMTSELYSQGKIDDMTKSYQTISRWLLAVTLPFFLILAFSPGATLKIFFGAEYVVGLNALRVLCIGQLINACAGSVGVILNMTGHERYTVRGVGTAAAMNILLNFVLIPKFGINGAAVATTVSLAMKNMLMFWWVYKKTGIISAGFWVKPS